MKVLVTGATGFIGRHSLAPLIAAGYEVHATCHTQHPDTDGNKITWHQLDLLDSNAACALIRQLAPSHMLHFGWYAEPGKYLNSLINTQWVSTTIAMLTQFAESGGQRFVAAGTCFEYDGTYGFCTEGHTPEAPGSLYGHCKNALRNILTAQAEQLDVSFAWGRIFFLYGPNEHPKRLVSSVVQSLLKRQQADCSAGTQIRDFMHVQDVAGAFVALLNSDVTGTVNTCSGHAVTIAELVTRVAQQLDAADLLNLGALPMRANEPPVLLGNTQRLSEQVRFTPQFDLDAGIADTIAFWRTELNL